MINRTQLLEPLCLHKESTDTTPKARIYERFSSQRIVRKMLEDHARFAPNAQGVSPPVLVNALERDRIDEYPHKHTVQNAVTFANSSFVCADLLISFSLIDHVDVLRGSPKLKNRAIL